ncbi:hypothetical protein, variant [Aphanomyces invadans]|uniref:EF-hand domain-containing protein n=1 Tax=Aphanomyces invadans TaxID=157072 RepID=A0A024UT40_9STRA|nr:hypothetical protein, variant [Aphanomyces invadans]ETW09087.1 hypothetical protein, variant [Aphanomyces invadans]|eukprot:XP_008862892.1 hypothetical protein, variant [Aphanomyces invadans]
MEREAEQVRVLNRGILRFYPSPGTDSEADAGRSTSLDKTNPQCIAHSNQFGMTVVTVPGGLGITRFATLEVATKESVDKKDNNMDPLVDMPFDAHVSLPTTPHVLSLSPSQTLLAVAFDSSLAIYELSRLVDDDPLPSSLINGADVLALSWSAHLDESGDDLWLAVLTSTRQIHVYSIQGNLECVESTIEATSHCWSPCNSILAVGDDEGVIHRLTFQDGAFSELDTLENPENTDNAPVHHINWAEADLLLAGYRRGDPDDVEVSSCLFEDGNPIPLDSLVDFFPNSDAPRDHAFYSCYLPAWRMFFVGCSLSTDIELLVCDPDTCEWQKWKPEERYTPRLPMNAADEDTFPVGMTLILNSTTDIVGIDDFTYAPCPLVLCATTDGLALNFALLDVSVGEALDFLMPVVDLPLATRPTVAVSRAVTLSPDEEQDSQPIVFDVSTTAPSFTFNPEAPGTTRTFGQDTENVFNEDSDDEDEARERAEEHAKASDAFDAVDTRGEGTIPLTDFEKLFDALGTVYSAEEHTNTIRKLDRKGVVRKDDFVAWYVDWIMADIDDDCSDGDATHGDNDNTSGVMKSDAEILALRERFRPQEGSWKCEECMVLNTVAGAARCVSCETPNPAAKATPKVSAGFAAFAAPPGEFKGFSFGVPSGTTPTPVATSATSGGFQFGVSAPPTGVRPSFSGAEGFSFGVSTAVPVPTAPAPGGFSFGVAPPTKQDSSTTVQREEKSVVNDTDNVFKADDASDDEEEERREEEAKASAAFDTVDTAKSGKIPAANFDKIFDALGTVYSADEHKKTLAKLNHDGFVLKKEFLAWYVDWIFSEFSDDDHDDVDKNTAVPDYDPHAKIKSETEIKAAFDKFKGPPGSWKCPECMIMNKDEKALQCASCEALNPNAPTPAATAPTTPGGFFFGVSKPSADPTTAPVNTPTFSFGVPASDSVATTKTTFDFGGAKGASPSFSFGVPPAPAVAKNASADDGGYGKDTDNVFTNDDSDGDDDEEERQEELKKASDAFDQVDTDTVGHISVSKFENLFDALGTVYAADEHKRTLEKLNRDGQVWKSDFVAWYVEWIFAELDSDHDDDQEKHSVPDFDPNAKMKSTEEIRAALGKFTKPAGSWTCDVCMVSNPDAKATKCAACESPNPCLPSQPAKTSTGAVTSAFGGISFGVVPSPCDKKSGITTEAPSTTKKTNSFEAISFGAGNAFPATKEFTFPVPTPATKAPDAVVAMNTTTSLGSGYPQDTSTKPTVTFDASAAPKASSAYPPDTSSKPTVAFGASAPKAASGVFPHTSSKPTIPFGNGGNLTGLSAATTTKAPSLGVATSLKFGGASTPSSSVLTPLATKPKDSNTIQLEKAMPATALEGEMWNLINVFDQTFQSIRRNDANFVAATCESESNFIQPLKNLRSKVRGLCDMMDKLNDSFNVLETDVKVIVGNCSDIEVQIECSKNLLRAMNDKTVIAFLEDQPLDKRSQNTRTALRTQLDAIDRMRVELEKHVLALKKSASSADATSTKTNDAAQLFRVLKLNYDTSKREYTRVLELTEALKQLEGKHQQYTRTAPKPARPVATKDLLKQLRQHDDTLPAFRSNLVKWTSQPIVPREVSAPVKRRPLRDTLAPSKPAPEVPPRVASKLMFGAKTTIPTQVTEAGNGVTFSKPVVVDGTRKLSVEAEKTPKSVTFSASTKPGAFGFEPAKHPSSTAAKPSSIRPNLSFMKTDDDEEEKTASPRVRKMSTSSRNGTPDRSSKSPNVAPMAAPLNVKPLDFSAKPKDSGMSAFSFTPSISKPPATPGAPGKAASTTPSASAAVDFGVKPKDAGVHTLSFTPTISKPPATPGTPTKDSATTSSTTTTSASNLIERLKSFYAEYAPGKSTAAAEKMIAQNPGKEEDVFHKLLQKYVSKDATVAQAKEYMASGKVPDALKSASAAEKPSPFGKTSAATAPATPSPFGTASTASSTFGSFGTTNAAAKPPAAAASPFGGNSSFSATATAASSPFGATSPASPSPFGTTTSTPPAASPFGAAPATPAWPSSQTAAAAPFGTPSAFGVDYRSKVVEFYKKHNPDKLAEVDTVLQKYKGKEEELLKKLEAKYNKPQNVAGVFGGSSPFGANASTTPAFGSTPSPFGAGQPAASGFGSASLFGAAATTTSSPGFGNPTPSPFGATTAGSPGFGVTSPFGAAGGAQSTATPAFGSTTPLGGGFGNTPAASPAFGATSAMGGTAAPAFGATTALGGATTAPAFGATTSLGGSVGGFGGLGASAPKFGAPSTLGSGGGFSSFAATSGATPSFGFGSQTSSSTAPAFGGGGFGAGGFAGSSFTQARR